MIYLTTTPTRARPPRLYVIMARNEGTNIWSAQYVSASKRDARDKLREFTRSKEWSEQFDRVELIPYTRARWAEGRELHVSG